MKFSVTQLDFKMFFNSTQQCCSKTDSKAAFLFIKLLKLQRTKLYAYPLLLQFKNPCQPLKLIMAAPPLGPFLPLSGKLSFPL